MNPNIIEQFHSDPAHWKLGIFYVCREDPRIVVPKRIRGMGWTFNFGRPLAGPFIVFMMALVVGGGRLARMLGASGEVCLAVKLLIAFGLILLCWRLAQLPKKSTTEEPASGTSNTDGV